VINSPSDTDSLQFADLVLNVERREAMCRSNRVEIKGKQLQLLSYLMANAETVVSRQAIYQDVWRFTFDPGTKRIEVQVSFLRKKLLTLGCTVSIRTHRGAGLQLCRSVDSDVSRVRNCTVRPAFESVLKSKNLVHLDKAYDGRLGMPRRRVSFILREHFSMMAFAGALDALVTANLMSSAPVFEIQVVGGDDSPVMSDVGIALSPQRTLAQLDEKQQSIIIVCGGFRVRLEEDVQLKAKLRSAAGGGAVLGGLWNGAYFLAEAGLLDDHHCAFHPDGRAMMAELFPKVRIASQSHVLDRQRISCAGANSALDMMLGVLRNTLDQELVSAIEEVLNCDNGREVSDVSVVTIDTDPTVPEVLKDALQLMHNNIEDPIEIDALARHVGICRRHLERLFSRHVNATPPRYYMELRLTRARQLLQQTSRPLIDIAVASGFATLPHFQRCFRLKFEMTPGQFRKRSRLRN